MRAADYKRVKRHFSHALVWIVCMMPLQCATLERLSLDDMIVKSSAIVRGKVTASWAAYTGSDIYTHYTIQVSERFKGTGGNTAEFVVPGGVVKNVRQSFSGTPTFNAGDEYVFFLWTSRTGLTWVVGLTQGLFQVSQGTAADPLTTRSATPELMLDPGTGRPVKDQTLVMSLSQLRSQIATTLGSVKAAAK